MAERTPSGHFYGYKLVNNLLTIIDAYDDDRRSELQSQLSEQEWSDELEMRRSADGLAEQIVSCSEVLAGPNVVNSEKDFQRIVHDYRKRVKAQLLSLLTGFRDKMSADQYEILHRAFIDNARSWTLSKVDSQLEAGSPLRLIWEKKAAHGEPNPLPEYAVCDTVRDSLLVISHLARVS